MGSGSVAVSLETRVSGENEGVSVTVQAMVGADMQMRGATGRRGWLALVAVFGFWRN